MQGSKHGQLSSNENDLSNVETCNAKFHQQKSSEQNMKIFHKSLKFQIYQCSMCHEAWPLKTKQKRFAQYICSLCVHDKSVPKKFSAEIFMIPSPVPKELQGLTQFEEMAIALKSISCYACLCETKRRSKSVQRTCAHPAPRCTTACRYTAQVSKRFGCHYFDY